MSNKSLMGTTSVWFHVGSYVLAMDGVRAVNPPHRTVTKGSALGMLPDSMGRAAPFA